MRRTVRAALAGRAHRRRPFAAIAAAGFAATLLVSGCSAGQISQTGDQVAAIDGANVTVGDIGVRNALLATPADNWKWAAGSDVELSFWLTNDGLNADTLTQVTSADATSVEITGTAAVQGNSRVQIGPDGAVRVTVKGLKSDLTFANSLPVTFVFASAGQVSASVPIEIPEQRTDERTTINIHPDEPDSVWDHGGEAHAEGSPAATSAAETSVVETTSSG